MHLETDQWKRVFASDKKLIVLSVLSVYASHKALDTEAETKAGLHVKINKRR